ncbi:hypothetical protein WG68_16840 [Arsukibacterium ikkense]|uniref:Uncharacterized protein n=1 Tax=Arsukibacterium ikkense TaxID=336831 RepID=A0A0M2V013_9GAMM|nr:tetratricopeptide repeat protein [Arsukibacterium ikkense]KKO44132.1 hypothetical protein WG68_16840 [Arsukibacterium ikkense]
MNKYLLILVWLLVPPLQADSFRPAADDSLALAAALPLTDRMVELLARLTSEPDKAATLEHATLELSGLYLQGARQPGFDDWFHEAEQWLDTLGNKSAGSINYLLLRADIQQQQHQFQAALQTLQAVLNKDPQHLSASLMAARVYLATAQHQAAQQACARLWQQDLFLFSVCSYEVAGRKGNWSSSYPALEQLYQRQTSIPPAIEIWVRGILAEQAEQLGQMRVAQQWLQPILSQAPTSLWLKWADLSLQLGEAERVFNKLSALQQHLGFADSLLVRLVMAEQQLTAEQHSASQPSFFAELAQRINVRIARGDSDHAADLAYYFLHIKPDAAAALHWAELNYQSAKEPDDLALLKQSKQAFTQSNKLTEAY